MSDGWLRMKGARAVWLRRNEASHIVEEPGQFGMSGLSYERWQPKFPITAEERAQAKAYLDQGMREHKHTGEGRRFAQWLESRPPGWKKQSDVSKRASKRFANTPVYEVSK